MNDNIDFDVPAELFPAPTHRRGALSYHRFNSLAEAVRYAVEHLTQPQRIGAFIEADELRYSGAEIEKLYLSPGYPLARSDAADASSAAPAPSESRPL